MCNLHTLFFYKDLNTFTSYITLITQEVHITYEEYKNFIHKVIKK